MKPIIAFVALGIAAWGTQAQGAFTFANKNLAATPPIDAKVFDMDGTTALSGTAYWTQAYVKLGTDPDSSYAPVGNAVNFRTGNNAGYIIPQVITTSYPGGTLITVQMRYWEASGGTSFEAAVRSGQLWGMSNGVSLKVTVAPEVPADMSGLASFRLIPEPSALTLGFLGGAALFLGRRRAASVARD